MQDLRSEGDGLTVGIVHWAVPPTIGGVESHIADYIRLLHNRGIKVVVFSGEQTVDEEIQRFATFEYHPYLHLAGEGTLPKDNWWRVLVFSRWLRQKIREHGVNVIHGHNLHNFSRVPAAAINLVCKKRIERHHTYHNYWENARCVKLVARWEGHWANSEYVAGQCRSGYPGRLIRERMEVRYLGIDPDRLICERKPFEGRNLDAKEPDKAPIILQPARLLRWKGPLHSVRMLGRLHEEGYRVRLVFTATEHLIDWDDERTALRKDLDELIENLKLGEWVTFLDRAHYSDMPRLFNDADIVINPSHGEPLGLVALEAMAASRPVVVTNSGGMAETFITGTGTLVVDDDDLVEHLFEAVHVFLDKPDGAIESGIEGRDHVVNKFHMRTYADKMIASYKESLTRSPRRAPSPVRRRPGAMYLVSQPSMPQQRLAAAETDAAPAHEPVGAPTGS